MLKGQTRASPLHRLRLRLTLLSAAHTGVVLVAMALVTLTIAEGQLRRSAEANFQSSVNAVTTQLQSNRVLSTTWLAQTEAADRLILSISDAGAPLRFSGSWSPRTDRAVLLERAAAQGEALGVDVHTPPLSVIGTTSTPAFPVLRDAGDRYLAAVVLIPAHGSWQSLVLLRDQAAADRQVAVLRLSFVALVVLGVALLVLLCWVFAGRAIRPIADSQRRQAEFIAAASHELRSPLTVIRASASALGLDPVQTRRLGEGIDRECARMARLVEDLLTLARSDAGAWSLERAPVDLDTLLLETAEDFYPVARRRGHTLALEVPDAALPLVARDAQRLRQILTVLLDNAFAYTPEGGRVTLSAAALPQWVCLRVSDSGPGIPPGQRAHIFDRFYRADAARNDKAHFGLGLSFARELAALHGGTFLLQLPR